MLQSLLTLLAFLIEQNISKTVRLSPLPDAYQNIGKDGAYLIHSWTDVTQVATASGLGWVVDVVSQKYWHFMIRLDKTFSFHPSLPSEISVTINGKSNPRTTNDILFGFTATNQEYLSMSVPMDNSGTYTMIYPQCNFNKMSVPLGNGDISSKPHQNRQCDIAAGDCANWADVLPMESARFPLTITFKNNPRVGLMAVYITSANIQYSLNTAMRCSFTPFPTDEGFKIYVAGNQPGNSFMITSFDITSETSEYPTFEPTADPTTARPTSPPTTARPTRRPTRFPTKSPTHNPTKRPTTAQPTNFPSKAPSKTPTKAPSKTPTKSPTKTPSTTPTKAPLNDPTQDPTKTPTNFPSGSPLAVPTTSPTKKPTMNPSVDPTSNPSTTPTLKPSYAPSKTPTNSPSKNPTSPTINPTNFPTAIPTSSPTAEPTTSPSKFPTNNPTLRPTGNPTPSPTPAPTNYPTKSPTKMPTKAPSKYPTYSPTHNPSYNPSISPTKKPTRNPTISPTFNPSVSPTKFPTSSPSITPTAMTRSPTVNPTSNPTRSPTIFAPEGYMWGAHYQLCSDAAANSGNLCRYNTANANSDANGDTFCLNPYECCLCKTITCGSKYTACNSAKFGFYAAYRVGEIYINGGVYRDQVGAKIYCQGPGSCLESVMYTNNVDTIHCDGNRACEGTHFIVDDPKDNFLLECSGIESCYNMQIDININNMDCFGTLPFRGIRCFDDHSCEAMKITINNRGCDKVSLGSVQCHRPTSCAGTHFVFNGEIEIDECKCGVGTSCNAAIGLDQCFKTLYKMSCGDPDICMGETRTIVNPKSGFLFECKNERSCQDAEFTIALTRDVTHLGPMKMSGLESAKDATFIIDNQQGYWTNVGVQYIECSGVFSCDGTTFISGDYVTFNRVICAKDACNGCLIKRHATDIGIPCDSRAIN